jgi:SAM-dependent methyltransferase
VVASPPRSGGAPVTRWLVRAADLVNRKGKSVGVRLVRYTGKSPHFIHPKHLVNTPWHDWYAEHLTPADVVLDVGCANGAHTLVAAVRCRRIFGLDYDARQLAVARRTAHGRGIGNAHFFAWDVTGRFPFADGAVDAALFLDVIEHLLPRVAVLREIHRVLRPDGRLLVSGPNRDSSWRRTLRAAGLFAYSDPDHKIEYSREEFLAELEAGGFTPVGPVMPAVYDTPWAGAIDALGGVSLGLYTRLARWRRETALRHPEESTGFQVLARRTV